MKKLMPIILIMLSIGIFFFFIDPIYKKIQVLNEEIKENNEMLTLVEKLQRERDSLQEKYNSIGDDKRARLEKVLPDTVDNVRLILDINNIAKDFGIAIAGISINGGGIDVANESTSNLGNKSLVSGNSNTSKYGTITVGFSVSATYDVFKQFLRRLEESLRLVDVRAFNVSAGDGVFYNYSVTLDTYWLR